MIIAQLSLTEHSLPAVDLYQEIRQCNKEACRTGDPVKKCFVLYPAEPFAKHIPAYRHDQPVHINKIGHHLPCRILCSNKISKNDIGYHIPCISSVQHGSHNRTEQCDQDHTYIRQSKLYKNAYRDQHKSCKLENIIIKGLIYNRRKKHIPVSGNSISDQIRDRVTAQVQKKSKQKDLHPSSDNVIPFLLPAIDKTGSHGKHQSRCDHGASDHRIKNIRKSAV